MNQNKHEQFYKVLWILVRGANFLLISIMFYLLLMLSGLFINIINAIIFTPLFILLYYLVFILVSGSLFFAYKFYKLKIITDKPVIFKNRENFINRNQTPVYLLFIVAILFLVYLSVEPLVLNKTNILFDAYTKEVNRLNQMAVALEKNVKDANANWETYRSLVADKLEIERTMAECKSNLNTKTRFIEDAEKALQALNNSIEKKKAEIEQYANEKINIDAQLNNDPADTEKKELERRARDLADKLAKREREMVELNNNKNKLETDIDTNKSSKRYEENRIIEYEAKALDADDKLKGLDQGLVRDTAALLTKQTETNNLKNEIVELGDELKDSVDKYKEHKAKVSQANDEIKNNLEQTKEMNKTISQDIKEMAIIDNEIKKGKNLSSEELEELKTQKRDLENKIENSKYVLNDLKEKKENIEEEKSKAEKERDKNLEIILQSKKILDDPQNYGLIPELTENIKKLLPETVTKYIVGTDSKKDNSINDVNNKIFSEIQNFLEIVITKIEFKSSTPKLASNIEDSTISIDKIEKLSDIRQMIIYGSSNMKLLKETAIVEISNGAEVLSRNNDIYTIPNASTGDFTFSFFIKFYDSDQHFFKDSTIITLYLRNKNNYIYPIYTKIEEGNVELEDSRKLKFKLINVIKRFIS